MQGDRYDSKFGQSRQDIQKARQWITLEQAETRGKESWKATRKGDLARNKSLKYAL